LLLIHAAFVLSVVVLGLRVFSWSLLQRQLLRLANWYSRFASRYHPSAQQLAWAIKVASLFVPKATCLPQALATQFLLIQHAYPADLKIGVTRNAEGKLEAHAWVASENTIIIGSVDNLDHFVRLSAVEKQSMEEYGGTF
jgi:hypothetical protein